MRLQCFLVVLIKADRGARELTFIPEGKKAKPGKKKASKSGLRKRKAQPGDVLPPRPASAPDGVASRPLVSLGAAFAAEGGKAGLLASCDSHVEPDSMEPLEEARALETSVSCTYGAARGGAYA